MIITTIEVIILIFYCVNLQNTLQTISVEIKNILYTGLGKYLTNTAWRIFWNQFQQYYSCCGNLNSIDWFETAWASPITLSFPLVKKFTQENGKLIIPAAPTTCCLPNTICNTFIDYSQPDLKKYYQNSCFSIITKVINLIASTRYLLYTAIIIQIITAIVKYEGYTENDGNPKSKL